MGAVRPSAFSRYFPMTTYTPENMNEVHLCLGLPHFVSRIADAVPVTLGPGVQLPSRIRTAGDLRKLSAWPRGHRLVIEQDRTTVRVEVA